MRPEVSRNRRSRNDVEGLMTKGILILFALSALIACGGGGIDTTTSTPSAELAAFTEGATVEAGDSFAYTMHVTCAEAFEANGSWWVASEKFFEHPNYPADWPVEVMNQSPVDGPDAAIEGVLFVVDAETVEFNLADGTPVAVFTPGEPSRCG